VIIYEKTPKIKENIMSALDTRPFNDRDGKIWHNGKLVEWRDATVHVLNHGLHYGSCVFEGIRVYNSKAFKLQEHNERLVKSAEILGFKIPYTVEELNNACLETIKANNIENGYIRPLAWRGSEQMAILTNKSTTHVAVATWSWPSYFGDEAKLKGLRLTWADWKRPSPETAPSHAKAAGLYMICTLSKNKAVEEGFDDALMLDYRGLLAEATGANIFLVVNGELHTPTPDCFLNGITRLTVIDLAKKNGIKVVERHIKPEELATAQEFFLTGSAAEVTPIASVEGKYGNFKFTVGEISKLLMSEYTKLYS
jgi:branched-chain amino acid aminotransferase